MKQNEEKLKKQIEELNKRIESGETVEVKLDTEQESASLTVNAEGAKRQKRVEPTPGTRSAVRDMDAAGGRVETVSLDLSAANDISNEQIIEKIRRASELLPRATRGARAIGDLPRVVLERDEAKRVWVLFQECSYQTGTHRLTAPAKYETDLASIPRVFWSIMAPEELSLAAPLFHDLIYRCAGELPQNGLNPFDGKVFTRRETDDLFYELMEKANVSRWKRTAAYLAVRGFAEFAWRKTN